MNRQEFEDTARRYREELFRMYANQQMTPPPPSRPAPPPPRPPHPDQRPASPPPPPRPPRPAPPPPMPPAFCAGADTPPDAVAVQNPVGEDLPPQNDVPSAPVPENNILPPPAQPEDAGAPASPKRPYTGIIRVHVVTAQGARPVPGASVVITRILHGEPELISLQTSDSAGNIEPVTVPAPPPSDDQRHPESYLYDITVQAAGYYREHSTDVPVFPNITSMQNFDLIPLPAGTDDTDLGGDLTYYNNMQQY